LSIVPSLFSTLSGDSSMQEFLHKLIGDLLGSDPGAGARCRDECGLIDPAVDHVVDRVSNRLRGISDYRDRLRGPVANVLGHIDRMVESVPSGFFCSRDNYVHDRRVNAFFVSPQHLSEVFSASREVRALFEANPGLSECWGLLCMQRKEMRRLGMDLVGDQVMKDVPQQVVHFTDHQILSPGPSEADARHALKCCIFNNLIDYARSLVDQVRQEQDQRRLRSRSSRKPAKRADTMTFRVPTLEDHLQLLVETLSSPQELMSAREVRMNIDRMGVIREKPVSAGYREELALTEIKVVEKGTRVGALVGFRRDDLLPTQNPSRNADIFLAM
jgi:hypothetical protein